MCHAVLHWALLCAAIHTPTHKRVIPTPIPLILTCSAASCCSSSSAVTLSGTKPSALLLRVMGLPLPLLLMGVGCTAAGWGVVEKEVR